MHALRKDSVNFSVIKQEIGFAIEARLKLIEDRKDIVLATLLDPRFKLTYLDENRTDQYKEWLICEAENVQNKNSVIFYSNKKSNKFIF